MRLALVIATTIALLFTVPMMGIIGGAAAFGGLNFALASYALIGQAGVIGLLMGYGATSSNKKIYPRGAIVGSILIAGLAIILAIAFLLSDDANNSPLYIGGLPVPILGSYVAALLACGVEVMLCWKRLRELKEGASING